jgi:hypothetical protein
MQEALCRALSLADPLLSRQEAARLKAAGANPLPVVLVVGAPRSGTTLLYKVLSLALPVSYPSNLTASFPRSPITASRLFGRALGRRRLDLESFYGNTPGLLEPNDAFPIWDRWFGENRYEPAPPDSAAIDEMRRFFAAWNEAFQRPFLNKNNRNTLVVRSLCEALPTSCFVVLRRDPIHVIQSLVEARRFVQGDPHRAWGLNSHDADPTEPYGYLMSVCEQVLEIEQNLGRQLATVPSPRKVELSYERFCAEPKEAVQAVSRMAFGVEQPTDRLTDLQALPARNVDRLNEDELAFVKAYFREARGQAEARR